jgi:DNA-binding NarL/FixJ family response regulator
MSARTSIPYLRLQPHRPWSPYRHGALFASDESTGSVTQARQPDRILVIEDDLLVAMQVETTLSEAGFDVVGVAPTGEEALELAAKDPPDLAIVDIRLAGDLDGVDTALELFRSHGIRCIFASAYSDDEARQRAAPATPIGWLQKPYTMALLTELVTKAAYEVRSKGRQ